jgi:hypothetical protein
MVNTENAKPAAGTGNNRLSCRHQPSCPPASAPDRLAAKAVASHPEQGWSLLRNGIITFDDSGAVTPAKEIIAPMRVRPLRLIHVANRATDRFSEQSYFSL